VRRDFDVERYTSPSRLEAERRILFRRLPIIVGRESDLPEAGRFFTHDAAGVPLLITRDPSGKVHAMLNVCRHRGTRLVFEPTGSAEKFVCKYHSWTYDLCGQLARPGRVSLPAALEQFMDESALVELPCETRHGFVWVVPAARAGIDVARWLGEVDAALGAREVAKHVVIRRSTTVRAANWKLAMDALLAGERRALVFPSSVLITHADGATLSHVAVFPHEIDALTCVHTLLAPPTGTESPSRVDLGEEELASAESIQARLRSDDLPPWEPHGIFHGGIDRAIAAGGSVGARRDENP
jgi:nitrite reductase/ring-hydroxylating ferredoxin subunit